MADKQKNKGKAHPFVGHLRPDEEILWMSSSTKAATKERLQSYSIFIGSTLALFTLIILADGAVTIDDSARMGRLLVP